MVPTDIVQLEALPLTQNGKIDRRALPAVDSALQPQAGVKALHGETEQKLATIWSELLGKPVESSNAHFFQRGGHSLLATQLVARIATCFGIDLPLNSIFAAPTLEAMAMLVANSKSNFNRIPQRLSSDDAEELLSRLDQLSEAELEHLLARSE
jgi:acyl carrier protein